ncbi:IS607 family transposase [Allochromatium tepidum]|uniref:IS607 family transposase ISTko2 n=1 Tax=Allochromatium tepidum TaxID=553982 RepID=A0ABM7QRK3_9GAMM|nr:IS607 family transposase [Allochromatium tepidum]BCU07430.1 IS607 family transposase ISTko2 [Allochromatium tepidum]BCU08289.1 IS607 family transposase ISTko2 [Allochromatium tepidum]
MERRLVKIGEAASLIGSTPATLRKWEKTGELLPARKTKGGTRYYAVADLLALGDTDAPTVCYARASGHDRKADLDRQHEMLETYCAAKGWRTEVIRDLGSGMNYRKKGLQRLLEMILRRRMRRLVITHKDRLLRFGSELVFALCEIQGIEIVIIHKGDQPSFEEDLAQDVLEIITVFSARLYGSRSKKHRKLLHDLQASADMMAEDLGIYDAARPQD